MTSLERTLAHLGCAYVLQGEWMQQDVAAATQVSAQIRVGLNGRKSLYTVIWPAGQKARASGRPPWGIARWVPFPEKMILTALSVDATPFGAAERIAKDAAGGVLWGSTRPFVVLEMTRACFSIDYNRTACC